MPTERIPADRAVVLRFVAHLMEHGHPDLKVDHWLEDDQTSMTDITQLIRVALKSKDAIPREHIRQWIKDADTVAADALLYDLTRDAWNRIQPTLERDETCALIQRYLLRCIRENPTDGLALTRHEAAAELEGWFDHLAALEDTHDIAKRVAVAVTDLFLTGDAAMRGAIETGFLEHVLEQRSLRSFFAHWARDERLQEAWRHALMWGEAHPDFTKGLREQLGGARRPRGGGGGEA
jgi:hypothetical protein